MIVEQDIYIPVASKVLFPLTTGRAPAYDEALESFQFAFTGDRTGAYVAPASTVRDSLRSVEVYPLFSLYLQKL